MSAQVDELRELIERRFPATAPVRHGLFRAVSTGIGVLDRALPGGGLPRGRLVVWTPGGGATAVLRSACVATTKRGERGAWVDGAGLVAGDSWWRGLAGAGGVELVRPPDPVASLASAEELLRSGGFGLVVLTGGAVGSATAGVRLSRAAREGGGAFVWLREGSEPVAGLRLRSWIPADGYSWRLDPFGEPTVVEAVRVRVSVSGLGLGGEVEFELGVEQHGLRLSLEPGLVDRRGAGA